MNKLLNIYKPIGLTPYQLIEKLRIKFDEYKTVKIGFAGRLDPLAHGVMLLMIGDKTKNREEYLNLDKEYEFEILLGVTTDTYDALGVLKNIIPNNTPENVEKQIKKFIKNKTGKQIQAYPPFSSIEINGKPLYQWAREGKLGQINIPEREINIFDFKLLEMKQFPKIEIENTIRKNIHSVTGDFRQPQILKKWNKLFENNRLKVFTVAKFKVSCSSGTYVRNLSNELGILLESGAIALSIFRTKVGNHSVKTSMLLA